MGQKGGTSSTTNQSSSSSPPPQVMAEYQGLVNRATDQSNTPYQQYSGEEVAPLSGQTTAGLSGVNSAAGAAQPYMNAAAGATMAAATPVQPTAFSAGQVGQYMNPYNQSVVDATQNQFNNQNQQSAQFLNSQNISSGAFGGDRAGISQAVLANQQQTAQAPVIAGLYNQNYNQALSEFNTQQGVGEQAQAFNDQQLGQMGNQMANIGTAAQSAGLQGSMAQIQAGMIPQQEQQSIDTALYNQYQQQQSYPFQTTGWLGNIIEGTGSLSGGTSQGTSTTTSQQGSPISSGIGTALSGLGILGSLSDARSKENIHPVGKTFDGQTIYRFNYKGDPRTQVGLIAQETEHHHPFAVRRRAGDGMRTVDYDEATRASAERGHFAVGGAAQPQQNLDTLPAVGQQAMTMGALGDQAAKAGMGNVGLMASSPQTALAAARPSYDSGGTIAPGTIDALGDINTSLNSNNQLQDPLAGVANNTYDDASNGTSNPQFGIDLGVPRAISLGPKDLSTPMTQVPGAAQNYPAIDWQNPGNDFQTAGAEASLQGLEARPGVETSPSESNSPASSLTSAAGQGVGGGAGGGGSGLGNSNLSNNLGQWASGNPVAFGADPAPGVSTAVPGSMSNVSVGSRMAPISAALGNGPAMGGALGGSSGGATGPGTNAATNGTPGVIQSASPPRAASPAPAVAAAAQPNQNPQIIYVQAPNQQPVQQSVHGGPGAGSSGGGGGGGFSRGGRAHFDVGGSIPPGGFDPTLPPLSTLPQAPPTAAQVNQGFGAAAPVGKPPPSYDGTALGTWTPSSGATAAGGTMAPANGSEVALPTAGPGQTSAGVGPAIHGVNSNFRHGGAARVYRAAGGMLGQTGMASALQQPPAAAMVNNGGDQPGFNNMFGNSGGMRPTFASGGGAAPTVDPTIGVDPFSQVTTWVPTAANTVMGKGPPQASSGGGGGGGKSEGGGGSGSPPDLSKAISGAKKLFSNVQAAVPGASSSTTTPTTPVTGGSAGSAVPSGQGGIGSDTVAGGGPPDVSVSTPSMGQGGIGSDAVAGGSGGDMGGTPDFGDLGDSTFSDAGAGADLGGGFDFFSKGGKVRRKRGHFASGGADDSDPPADGVLTQNTNDPNMPLSVMKNDPENGGDVVPPPPARPVSKTPDKVLAAETASASPADQGPPPRAVDDAKAASIVGSQAPAGHFKITDPNPDPLTSHAYPAPTETSGAAVPPATAPPPQGTAPAIQRQAAPPPVVAQTAGRGAPSPAPTPGQSGPGPGNVGPVNLSAPTPPPVPSSALVRARLGQPSAGVPAYAPGQDVPASPAVSALGQVKPAGANLNAPAPLPQGQGGTIFPDLPANRAAATPAQRADFIQRYVKANYPNADPRIALGIANAEGLGVGGSGPSSVDVDPTGKPFSFGDFQMNVHKGALGDDARRAGIDPEDPNQWQQTDKFAIDKLLGGKGGPNLQPWSGDAYAKSMIRSGQAGEPGPIAGQNTPPAAGGRGGVQVAQAGASDYDPNTVLSKLTNGKQYFGPKDYQDPNSSKRELFSAMMMAGFAMMGGESRNPMINIGRGAMSGMEYYQKQQGLDRDWIEKQAQIDHLSHDDRRADADVALRAQQFGLEALRLRNSMSEAEQMNQADKDNSYGFGKTGAAASGPAALPPPKPVNAGIGAPGAGAAPVQIAGQPGEAPPPSTATPYAGASAPAGGPRGAPGGDTAPGVQTAAAGQPQPAAAGTSGAPRMDWNDAPPEMRPQTWLQRAQIARSHMDFDNAAKYATKAQEIANAPDYYSMSQGRMVPMPGKAEVDARTAGMKAGAEAQGKAQNEPVDAFVRGDDGSWSKERFTTPAEIAQLHTGTVNGQPVRLDEPPELAGETKGEEARGQQLGENSGDVRAAKAQTEQAVQQARTKGEVGTKQMLTEDETQADASNTFNVQEQRLQAMQKIMERWQPGAWATHKAEISNIFHSAGVPIPDGSDAVEFAKNSLGEVFDAAKTQKGALRNLELIGYQKANPEPDKPAQANAAIISQMLGVVHQRQQFIKDYSAWRQSPEGQTAMSPNDYVTKWNQDPAHKIQNYVDKESQNFGYLGQPIPPANKRPVGQVYMSSDGQHKGRWTGGGWQPVQ
jgi:hypothetical protein